MKLFLLLTWIVTAKCFFSSSISRPSSLQVTRFWLGPDAPQPVSTEKLSSKAECLIRDLLICFQGEFDNYDQVVEDRRAGMTAGSRGGHEHFHCSLKILDDSVVPPQIMKHIHKDGHADSRSALSQGEDDVRPLAVVAAKYFFNGDASRVFRYRFYSFHECSPNEEDARGSAVMRLWRFFPPVEHRLRAAKYDLNGFEWHSDRDEDECVAELMHGCDIYWSRAPSSETDLSLDGGDEENEAREGLRFEGTVLPFVGLMGNDDEGTWISSQLVEGMSILVKDNLKVWPDRLWINDRGFDGEGNFVYGNQRGVPYKMRRATPGGPLGWTLGDEYRSSELYAKKMHAIGVMPE